MATFAISMCKDEADVVEDSLRHMAAQVDALIVADNGSTDGTRDLLADLAKELPLTVLDDPEVGYFQSRKMSALAAQAAAAGADWIVPFDQDELWYSPFGRIADVLADHWPIPVATAALYDHVATGADPDGPPMQRMGWRRTEPAPLVKVACRAALPVTIHQGNHECSYPPKESIGGQLIVMHYPYRSPEQVIRKIRNGAAAYAQTDLPEHEGAHWRQWGKILEEQGEDAIVGLFHKWFWRLDPTVELTVDGERQDPLIYDPCPLPQ